MSKEELYQHALTLLQNLIRTPSLSKEEERTGDLIEQFLQGFGIATQRQGHNIWVKNEYFDPQKPTILLNSHHDTVKPNAGYTRDPFLPEIVEGKLFGLGSNDAGGCLVSLIVTFVHYYAVKDLSYNLILAATAEEEISGKGGVESILPALGRLDYGIIGEPTEMQMSVAEKGLMVLDCLAKGKAGHAARDVGINAIYEAFKDIEWFRNYKFEEESQYLGPIKMSVTQISAGYQHNVVPDSCAYVVDVRTTDAYTNEEVVEIIKRHVQSEVQPRSTRLRPSGMPPDTPLRQVAEKLGIEVFGSPTTSDQAVIPIPTIKMGPGRSERSHTPDEFIFVDEIKEGIEGYINVLKELHHFI